MDDSIATEVVDYWGVENLRRWSIEAVDELRIPSDAKEYLCSVGLPCNVDWIFSFDPDADDCPSVSASNHLKIIGYHYEVPICIDEDDTGAIVAAESVFGDPDSFINESVIAFGHFLMLFRRYGLERADSVPDIVNDEIVDAMEQRMRHLDISAFQRAEAFWPVIINQMHDGLL